MSICFLDIETLPSNNPEVIQRLKDQIKPPGNITKPESIEKWMVENADAKHAELVAKTSLDGAYGRIACIAWCEDNPDIIYTTLPDMTEEEVIHSFYRRMDKNPDSFCGHNVNFDLQFLKHRSMILRIKPPEIMLYAFEAKPWDDILQDTMLLWTNDRNKYISIDTLCQLFGIPGKDGFDGSMVAETWKTDPARVIEYCADDVIRTYQVYKRLTFDY